MTATPPLGTLGATTWYFAEGYTGPGFDEYLTIQNPNSQPADLTITYFLTGSPSTERRLVVAGNSRYTVAVHEEKEGVGRNSGKGWPVSARLVSANAVGVVVERPMYFRYPGSAGLVTGGHNVLGVQAPLRSWLFAEGYTGPGFDEYLTIMNPHGDDAPVTLTYFLGGGRPSVVKQIIVPRSSRYTVAVHEDREGVGRDQAVSAMVETSLAAGVIVERPMYFRYTGSMGPVIDGHNVMGAAAAATTWYFPDGNTTPGFDEYLTLMNPADADAQVQLTYYQLGKQAPQTRSLTVPANSRYTVSVHETREGVGRGYLHGTGVAVTNGVPLVVERPMYFAYDGATHGIRGGDTVMGASRLATSWLFAEGYTGDGVDEYLMVLNPGPSPATVAIIYYLATGGPVERPRRSSQRARVRCLSTTWPRSAGTRR